MLSSVSKSQVKICLNLSWFNVCMINKIYKKQERIINNLHSVRIWKTTGVWDKLGDKRFMNIFFLRFILFYRYSYEAIARKTFHQLDWANSDHC